LSASASPGRLIEPETSTTTTRAVAKIMACVLLLFLSQKRTGQTRREQHGQGRSASKAGLIPETFCARTTSFAPLAKNGASRIERAGCDHGSGDESGRARQPRPARRGNWIYKDIRTHPASTVEVFAKASSRACRCRRACTRMDASAAFFIGGKKIGVVLEVTASCPARRDDHFCPVSRSVTRSWSRKRLSSPVS